MDKVHETGECVVITKHGKPVAKLVPAERERRNMWGDLAGTVKILGDIESPVTADWEAS
jgi:antitoxin (DNA-binding transcriptional repressor) of toxin-antitoxin stability system